MDFDETRLYYSHQQLQTVPQEDNDDENEAQTLENDEESRVDLAVVRRHFREFLRNYRQMGNGGPSAFIYREKLSRLHSRGQTSLTVDLSHLGEYDSSLLGFLTDQPSRMLPACETAAVDALKSILFDQDENENRPADDDDDMENGAESKESGQSDIPLVSSIQILLKGNLQPTPLRSISAKHMNKLLKCPGIVISSSPVKNRAVRLQIRCGECQITRFISSEHSGGNLVLPSRCTGENCPTNPFTIVPDASTFVDQQNLKLQEAPERVPTGEMPRSVMLAVERSLVDRASPGTRVAVYAIPTLGFGDAVFLRVVGMESNHAVSGGEGLSFTPAEEEAFTALARHSDVYDILYRSLAPSISGNYTIDIKKALICQLMAGSPKQLRDGVRLRGDINVLLLGDPSMAKSQFLKFVSKVAPVGIYTSGKGSSAAGLTASVIRNARGEFYLEGGAMVLADGGIVCIDEFDKMRPADRVAIHEAMEQQTISVAKAGITTVLHSRAAVLAAANPVYGRYDDCRSASENIDLMTTILSRFDLIFLVRDIREEERDRMICQHVMGVHINSSDASNNNAQQDIDENSIANSPEAIAHNVMSVASTGRGELAIPAMKKYILYCKTKCSPRLSGSAEEVLCSSYVRIRENVRKQNTLGGSDSSQATIPITVRQLEALVRLSESLAKMRLDDEVQPADVTEALRLFSVSTMSANTVDEQRAVLGGGSPAEMERTEIFLRGRLVVGNVVNKQRLVEEAAGQGFNAVVVSRVLSVMTNRGDLTERNQGRLVKRVK